MFFPPSYPGYRDCTCVKVNSCQWSKKLQDEVKNIQTNSIEDIKVKRKKIKEIKDHWCTLKNGKIGVNCCQNDKPPKCRTGCDCRPYKHCDWSLRDVQALSMMNQTETLFIVTRRRFRENICSASENKVCCCGVREVCNSKIIGIKNFWKNMDIIIERLLIKESFKPFNICLDTYTRNARL